MATCDIATLITDACASGFKCLSEEQYRAALLQLLCNATESLGYQSYVAKISSNGANAPTVTVLQNSIGPIVWTRQAAGIYRGALAGALPSTRTVAFLSDCPTETGSYVTGFFIYTASNQISVEIFQYDSDGLGTGTDAEMFNASIEIRVYPP